MGSKTYIPDNIKAHGTHLLLKKPLIKNIKTQVTQL